MNYIAFWAWMKRKSFVRWRRFNEMAFRSKTQNEHFVLMFSFRRIWKYFRFLRSLQRFTTFFLQLKVQFILYRNQKRFQFVCKKITKNNISFAWHSLASVGGGEIECENFLIWKCFVQNAPPPRRWMEKNCIRRKLFHFKENIYSNKFEIEFCPKEKLKDISWRQSNVYRFENFLCFTCKWNIVYLTSCLLLLFPPFFSFQAKWMRWNQHFPVHLWIIKNLPIVFVNWLHLHAMVLIVIGWVRYLYV